MSIENINNKISKLIIVLIFVLTLFFVNNTSVKAAIVNIGDTENFEYTGDVQTFTATKGGLYKLETWGAQGGSANSTYIGGYGGYSTGVVKLKKGETLYINVGGAGISGNTTNIAGGYNGGGIAYIKNGKNDSAGSGGGATSIATTSGLLNTLQNKTSNLLIVSGGGGGYYYHEKYNSSGGNAGGYLGGLTPTGTCVGRTYTSGSRASQSTGGTANQCDEPNTSGSFGQGGNGTLWAAGGGGGYYGGGAGYAHGGSGGSGYIGNSLLVSNDNTTKHMTCYNCETSDETGTKTISNTCHSSAATVDCAKEGDGYAKVTFLGNNDTTLKTLTVSGHDIMPALRNDKRDYIVFINEDETSLTLTAETNDTKASVLYNSTISITEDTTTETLTVTAEDGTVGIYTLNIYKQIPSDMGGEYAYTGDVQTFTATKGGLYKIETWGAQGGTANDTYIGGYGGYSTGVVKLKKGETIYIYVGGSSSCTNTSETISGGYNGGGLGHKAANTGTLTPCGGGGATHIATSSGLLSTLENNRDSILIVSGGGSGAYVNINSPSNGNVGGGYIGGYSYVISAAGTQENGYQFGASNLTEEYQTTTNYSGGGGGYYGGIPYWGEKGAGGGSGYIGNSLLVSNDNTTKHMTCYNCETSDAVSTKTISNTCHSTTATVDCAKEGDGYARIMFIEEYKSDATLSFLSVTDHELDKQFNSKKHEYNLSLENIETIEINATPNDYNATVSGDGIINVPYGESTHEIIVTAQDGTIGIYKIKLNRKATPEDEYSYNYTGDVQEFIAPVTGKYKLETWGAQGGSADNTYVGGYGAYSTGTISLKANQKVYIYVGGEGQTTTNGYSESVAGGFNGGGAANISITSCSSATQYKSSGGGATHMATTSGLLNTLENNKSNILIVSAGGGGGSLMSDDSCYNQHSKSNGGSGAGYQSKVESFEEIDYQESYTCYSATQNSAGYCTYNGETKGPGSFGVGGSYVIGGGGGYYGGASGTDKKSQGGVSYIGNTNLTDKHMTCYKCEKSSEESTKTSSTACFSISPKEDCSKRGNGYAKITPLGIESEDATLKSLTVTDQELKQAFDPERLNYDLLLDEGVTSVEINAEANDEKASLTYNQNVELTSNPQLEEIIVTAEDGTINVYSINIKRVKKSYLKTYSNTKFNNITGYQSDTITTFRKATQEEYNAVKDTFTDINTISLSDSPYPTYAWKSNDNMLYYSEADVIYMNPNSSSYFTPFKNATSIDLSSFDTSKVTNMSAMFSGLSKLESLDLSNFDTSKVTNMESMFSRLKKLESLDLSNFDTSNVIYMGRMFEQLILPDDLDLSNFDTSNVKNMYSMFVGATIPNGIDLSSFDTSEVTNIGEMFYATTTDKLDLKHFDVSKVNYFSGVFNNSNVEEIDISGWIFNVSSTGTIFYGSKVTKLILDDIDTTSITDMSSLFSGIKDIKELDLSSLDTENVTNMSYMFYASDKIESLDLSSFDTSKVTTMEEMFSTNNVSKDLKNINLSSFKVYNVTNMKRMFHGCTSLEELDLRSFDVSKVTTMESMFSTCKSLKTIDLSNFYSPNLTNISSMFAQDQNLERIYVSEGFTTNNATSSSVFYQNTKLIGGMGTMFNVNHVDSSYARIDDPENGNPGYFTYREFKPKVNYPDGTYEEVTFNTSFQLPGNWPNDNESFASVTFKYQNGEEDSISYVTKEFSFNDWKVNGEHYNPNTNINIIADTYLEPTYNETIQSAIFPENPTSEHATFLGWYTEPTGGEQVTSYNGEEDITLYAHWDVEDMVISFEENDGEEISDITIPYGNEIGELPTTTKTGFIFEGWYLDEELTNKVSSTKVVNDNMTLYAKWIEDDFPIVYQDDEEVFDGTNYLNTHIKLYNEENYLKDYEIGFTISEFDPALNQESNLTFVNAKYENESLGWPGLVVRYNYISDIISISQSINGERKMETIEPPQINKKYRIIRKDNVVYYSVDNGELVEFQDTTGFNQFHEVETTFGASQDVDGNPFRFIHAKLSNMYIRLGETHDDHMVTYPDGNVEIYPHNTIINLGNNNSTKSDKESATVTFKYHNGSEDTTSKVITKYTANGFKIDDTHYDDSTTLLVDSDKIIEYDYDELVSTAFPEDPTKDGFKFVGWYTEEEDGEKVESYAEKQDITLHAIYKVNEAYVIPIEKVRKKISENSYGYEEYSRIFLTIGHDFKYFRKATKEEYNQAKDTLDENNVFSTEDSPFEVYFWISGDNCLFYSEANNIYLNEKTEFFIYNLPNLIEVDMTGLNASRVVSMTGMFSTNPNLKRINLPNFDTSSANKMNHMFSYNSSLETLDLSSFNTGNTTDMDSMFIHCESIETLDLSSFNTSKVTNMSSMFGRMYKLKDLNISSFDTSKVTTLHWLFNRDSSLTELDLSHFNTSNVTDMSAVFGSCGGLKELDISTWDTSNVINMNELFSGTALETLNLSSWDTSKVKSMSDMFAQSDLTTIYVSDKWSTESVTSANGMFRSVYDLVGGMGTVYDSNHINKIYAHIDEGESNPGYLTDIADMQTHMVTLPDGEVVTKYHNNIIRYFKDEDIVPEKIENTDSKVTFKYHNGEPDTVTTINRKYNPNFYKVNGEHVEYGNNIIRDGDNNAVVIRIDEDKVIEYDYIIELITDFPENPTKEYYDFDGWYTEEIGGEKVENFDTEEDITVHAHWKGYAYLDSLTANIGTISPTFEKGTNNYTWTIPKDTPYVLDSDIEFVKSNPNSTVVVPERVDYTGDNDVFNIDVTSEDGTNTNTYTLNMVYSKSDNAYLKSLTSSVGNIKFRKDKFEYEISVENKVDSISFDAEPEDRDAIIYGIGEENQLYEGENWFNINVQSEDENHYNSYRICVLKNYMPELEYIDVDGYMLSPEYNSKTHEYEVNVLSTQEKVNIDAKLMHEESGAIVSGLGELELTEDTTDTEIVLMSRDGDIVVYSLRIIKSLSDDYALKKLRIYNDDVICSEGECTLNPTFDPQRGTYSFSVPYNFANFNLDIETNSENIHYTVELNGSQPWNYRFNFGENTLKIILRDADEKVLRKYTVNVYREHINLQNLEIGNDGNADYTVNFEDGKLKYDLEVAPEFKEFNYVNINPDIFNYEYYYNGNYINSGDTFKMYEGTNVLDIGVYDNHNFIASYIVNITRTRTTPGEASDTPDLRLKELIISNQSLDPEFDPDTNEYSLSVNSNDKTINIAAELFDESNIVTGLGEVEVPVGETTHNIVVTSQTGDTNIYVININRRESNDSQLSKFKVNKGRLKEEFNPWDNYITWIIPRGTEELIYNTDFELETNDSGAAITVPERFECSEENNEFDVLVTAENGSDTTLYFVTLKYEANNDARLKTLTTDIGKLTPTFESDTMSYELTVYSDTEKVNFEAETLDKNADVVSGLGEIEVTDNMNHTIMVMAEDGTIGSYNIIIRKTINKNKSLENLEIGGLSNLPCVDDECKLTPQFNPETLEYEIKVPYEYDKLIVNYTKSDENQVVEIKVNDEEYVSNMDLGEGETNIKVNVYGQFEDLINTYTINLSRQKGSYATLDNIEVNIGELKEEFDKDKTSYTWLIPKDTEAVLNSNVTVTKTDPNSSVSMPERVEYTSDGDTFDIVVTAEDGVTTNTYTLTLEHIKSSDARLKTLESDIGFISPEFDKDRNNYLLEVYTDTEVINLTGETNDSDAVVVSGLGEITLENEETTHEIEVTAEDGTTNIYSVVIKRNVSTEITVNDIKLYDNDKEIKTNPVFSGNTNNYEASVSNQTERINVVVETNNDEQSYKLKLNDSYVEDVDLLVGENTLEVEIYDKLNKKINTYIYTITRFDTSNAYLMNIEVEGYELTPEFNKETYNYTLTVGKDVNEVNVIATSEDEGATITGSGIRSINYGENNIDVVVTSINGEVTKTYTIMITRELETDNFLLTLESNVGEFDKSFDKDINEYTLTLPAKTQNIILTGTVSNMAEVTGLGEITIDSYEIAHEIVVTSQSGSVNTYLVNIIKEKSNNTNLINLVPSIGSIEYSNDITEYEINVKDETNKISFEATLEDADATIVGIEESTLDYGENIITITVTAEDGITTREITVKVTMEHSIEDIHIESENIVVVKGKTQNINASALPEGTVAKLLYSSSNSEIVTVDEEGNITGVSVGEANVEIKAEADENIKKQVTVTVVSDKLESDTYSVKDKIVDEENTDRIVVGADEGTKISEFKANMLNPIDMIKIYDEEGNLVDEDEIVKTGMIIKLESNDVVYDEAILIVKGDITKDGIIDVSDKVLLQGHILGKEEILDYRKYAADTEEDDLLDVSDNVKLSSYILGNISTFN